MNFSKKSYGSVENVQENRIESALSLSKINATSAHPGRDPRAPAKTSVLTVYSNAVMAPRRDGVHREFKRGRRDSVGGTFRRRDCGTCKSTAVTARAIPPVSQSGRQASG